MIHFMTRRNLAVATLLVLLNTLLLPQAEHSSTVTTDGAPKIKIAFPEGVHLEKALIIYSLLGPKGGRNFLGHPNAGIPSFGIEATPDNGPVDRFRAVVWVPGCKFKKFDVAVANSNVDLGFVCDKLRNVTLVGRVKSMDKSRPAKLAVGYGSSSICEFLDACKDCVMSCFMPQFDIADVEATADGRFEIKLPDFAADPIASVDPEAGFFFVADYTPVRPELSRLRTEEVALRIASSYPAEVSFAPIN
jgi:hypothetical protein